MTAANRNRGDARRAEGADGRANADPEWSGDAVMPSQFFDLPGGILVHCPERRLMLAVLEHAVATIMRGTGATSMRRRKDAACARRWVDSNEAAWPFAFRNVCEHLGLETDALREGLVRWQARQLATGDAFRFPFTRPMVGAPRVPKRRWRRRAIGWDAARECPSRARAGSRT